MITVINEWGTEIDFEAAVALMDEEIVESLDGTTESDQEYFDAYCKAHEEKYGEEFECAKENPCY